MKFTKKQLKRLSFELFYIDSQNQKVNDFKYEFINTPENKKLTSYNHCFKYNQIFRRTNEVSGQVYEIYFYDNEIVAYNRGGLYDGVYHENCLLFCEWDQKNVNKVLILY